MYFQHVVGQRWGTEQQLTAINVYSSITEYVSLNQGIWKNSGQGAEMMGRDHENKTNKQKTERGVSKMPICIALNYSS